MKLLLYTKCLLLIFMASATTFEAQCQSDFDAERKAGWAEPEDTSKVNAFIKLGKAWHPVNTDSALYYTLLTQELADPAYPRTYHRAMMAEGHLYRRMREYVKADSVFLRESERLRGTEHGYFLIDALGWLGRNKISQDQEPDAIIILEEALALLDEYPSEYYRVRLIYRLAKAHVYRAELVVALKYYEQALPIAQAINDSAYMSLLYNSMALVVDDFGDYHESFRLLEESMKIDQALNDSDGMASTLINMGMIMQYTQLEGDTSSAYYTREAMKIFKALKQESDVRLCLHNLGGYYYTAGYYEQAMTHFKLGFNHSGYGGSTSSLALSHFSIGLVHYQWDELDEAFERFRTGLAIVKEIGRRDYYSRFYSNIALCYFKQGKYEQAIADMEHAIACAHEINRKQTLAQMYRDLAMIYEGAANYKRAFESSELARQYQDTLNDKRNETILANTRTRFEVERTAKENLALELDNQQVALANAALELENQEQSQKLWIFNALLGLALLGIALTIIFLRRKSKRKQESLNHQADMLKHQLLRAQMNPHFIFNALMAIQSYMIENNAPKASDYLSKFAKLTRQILDYSRRDTVSVEGEVALLENYLALQQMRFPNQFEFELDVDPKLIAEGVEVPPMLAQPFLENAIEHGLAARENGGHVRVALYGIEGGMRIEVEDNGKGIGTAQDKLPHGHHVSMAQSITRERLEVFDRIGGGVSSLSYEDIYPDREFKGTRVVLHVAKAVD